MKKYISLFSLIAVFFIGMQHTQAQELERRSLDNTEEKQKKEHHDNLIQKHNGPQSSDQIEKKAKLRMIEATTKTKDDVRELDEVLSLSADQQNAMHKVLLDLNLKLLLYGDEDTKKVREAKAPLIEEANQKIIKVLDDKQIIVYKEHLEKKSKN
ncbi:hypothetical protein ACFS5M_12085 [Lacinutrix iliipiscaria]|uniref:Uncharacterized protein n=1 Tax=Lacinutrix iliipiscaria TaxID=1230532 RepID=A0ABW5WT17_9FLAO